MEPSSSANVGDKASPSGHALSVHPCHASVRDISASLLSNLRASGVKLFLLETRDILRAATSPDSLTRRFLDEDVVLCRFGVFAEYVDKLYEALAAFEPCRGKVSVLRGRERNVDTSVFVVVEISNDTLGGLLKTPRIPFFLWKRFHFRVFHLRGRKDFKYRWTGEERDEEDKFNLPAEAFDDFALAPVSPNEALFFRPEDVDLFVWRKEASEFKECNEENMRTPQSLPRGRVLKDENNITSSMNALSAVRRFMAEFRIRSFLKKGALLGWWRQCSLIPGDTDVDLSQWSSVVEYPGMIKALVQRGDFIPTFVGNGLPAPFGDENVPGESIGFFLNLNHGGRSIFIDVWFLYRKNETRKVKENDGRVFSHSGDGARLYFSLCSADLHGHLVHVPCSDHVIHRLFIDQYGENYMEPDLPNK